MIGKSTQDLVNQPIIDRYRLQHFIHRGETKSVYQAVDVRTARPVAFKLMRLDQGPTDRQQRIQQFGKIMEGVVTLDHPHILPILDFGVMAGEKIDREYDYVYVVMPLMAERSLDEWLRAYWQRRNSAQAQLDVQDVQQFVQQAAQSLQYAHERNILHLGIKQTNFLVRREGDERFPYLELADFGVARFTTPPRDQVTMAPEQLAGRPVAASDQYALAVMAYELLTGRPYTFMRPNGQSYSGLFAADVQASRLSAGASEVLQRALAPDPQARYTSIAEFAEEFAHVAERGKRGENLYIMLGVSRAEAQSGASLPVTLAGKRQVMVNVPPNAHAGQVLQIEDAGKPSQSGGPRGALVVTLALRPDPPGIQPGNNQPVLEEIQRLSHDIKTLQARPTSASATTPANASADIAGLSEQVSRIEHMVRILRTYDDYVKVEGPQDIPRYLVKQFRPGLVVVGIVLALIIIVSNCMLSGQLQEAIYLNGTSNIDAIIETNNGMTATAQANVNGTATAKKNVQATATATYVQSLEAAADSQTIPALYHINADPENVSLVFNDLLNKSNSGQWENFTPDDNSDSDSQQNLPCYFGTSDNFYHANASKSGTIQLCHSSGPAGTLALGNNLLLQVQAFIQTGDGSGMQFGTKDSFCYIYITQTGEYEIGMNGKPFTNGKGKSNAIITGTGAKVSNLLSINISNKTVTFYVNLQPVLTVNEVTLPSNGNVALAARSIGDPTDVAYQKIKAWQY